MRILPSRVRGVTLGLTRDPMRVARRPPSVRAIACGSVLVLCSLLLLAPPAHAQGAEPSRGRLLYETHCIACHNSQMHWRDQRLARDWAGLLAQVRGWQARAELGWSDGDITEVARHLNDTIYRFQRPLAQAPRPAPMARDGV